MADIRADATRYERIDKPTGNGRFDLFLARLKALGTIVFHPLLLEAMERHREAPEVLDRLGVTLESYLVRRMVCGRQTRGYGDLNLRLLRVLREGGDADAATLINDALLAEKDDKSGKAYDWPDDATFKHNWVTRQFYGYFRRERVAMILQAIEHHYQSRSTKSEPLMSFAWSQVQIEHIMPRAWEANWPLPAELAPAVRNASVQNVGNLTLVSQALNPTMSNAPWFGQGGKPGKRDHLHAHAIMHSNRRLLDRFQEGWSDADIRTRAELLFEDAVEIWPR